MRRRLMRWGRLRWRAILLCLLAGAAINVLVAWGCALWSPTRESGIVQVALERRPGGLVGTYEVFRGELPRHSMSRLLVLIDEDVAARIGPFAPNDVRGGAEAERWSDALCVEDYAGPGLRHTTLVVVRLPVGFGFEHLAPEWVAVVAEAGWPLPSLTCRGRQAAHIDGVHNYFNPAPMLWCGGLEIPAALRPRSAAASGAAWLPPFSHPLPLRPLWGQFALNTLVYAGLAAVPLAALERRRGSRRRRGLCPVCAYAVGTADPCPECGTPREAAP